MSARLTPEHMAAQRAITIALVAANQHRADDAKHETCIKYAARQIDRLRPNLETVDPATDRAWRD